MLDNTEKSKHEQVKQMEKRIEERVGRIIA